MRTFQTKVGTQIVRCVFKWGVGHINENEQSRKIYSGTSYILWKHFVFVWRFFIVFEFCQNFVDSRHLKCSGSGEILK